MVLVYKDLPAPGIPQFTLGSARVNISPLQAKRTLEKILKNVDGEKFRIRYYGHHFYEHCLAIKIIARPKSPSPQNPKPNSRGLVILFMWWPNTIYLGLAPIDPRSSLFSLSDRSSR